MSCEYVDVITNRSNCMPVSTYIFTIPFSIDFFVCDTIYFALNHGLYNCIRLNNGLVKFLSVIVRNGFCVFLSSIV